ncbi:hypothetical protein PQX77_002496 [Marasmius sp. AFHP31]|nr:hypothetical protein PQX77_002496 [Marasmius sp. AFHP31]
MDNLRLHTICSTTPPKEASLSDFGYAAAPAFGQYLRQSKNLSDEAKGHARRELLELIWSCWSEVWEGGAEFGDRKLTSVQKSTLNDIVAHITSEYELHRYYVTIGHKADESGDSNQWITNIRTAIRQSDFQRWVDPEYLQAICPPPPPPTPVGGSQYADLLWEEAWQAMLQDYTADWGSHVHDGQLEDEVSKEEGVIQRGDWELLFQ